MQKQSRFYLNEIKKLSFYDQLLDTYETEDNLLEAIHYILQKNDKSMYDPENQIVFNERDSIFDTENERLIFLAIEEKLDSQYRILPEVCFRKVIGTEKYQERSLTLYKFADFFICDKNTFKPLISIEFDEEHHREKLYEIIRDISKNLTLDCVNIPHITIEGTKYSLNTKDINKHANKIIKKVNEILN